VEYLKSQFPSPLPRGEGEAILLGILSDKDAAGMVKVLSEIAETFYCVAPNTPRALPAEDLAQIVREAGRAAVVTTIADMKRTWKGPGTLIVTGSFYTVGEFCEPV
jgi:dihydrofolate synthase/folylpolyglutamate synthase